MLMVVFGAGASYDSVPAYPPTEFFVGDADRMPLANELFDNRTEFARDMGHFPQCRPIIPYLLPNQTGISLERVLQTLQDEAEEYPERYEQLAAVRYYLQVMLGGCEERWTERSPGGISNQITLIDQIERWRKHGEQVCIVTFNYDLMLETALEVVGVQIKSLQDYVADRHYKLIKLHGSVNWGREVDLSVDPDGSAWPIVDTLINRAASLEPTRNFRLVDQRPVHHFEGRALFPAIAIPVESKVDYECPEEHLEILRAVIPHINKLMVVGWRGAEIPFLNLVAQNLAGPIQTLVVAESDEAATETANRLNSAGIKGYYTLASSGFTGLVTNRLADDFLRR